MSTASVPEPGPIRVLAARLSDELYRALLEARAQHNDLSVIGRAADTLEALIVAATGVDIILLEGEGQPAVVGHILGEYPELKIVVIHPAGGATIFWRGLRQRVMGDLAPSQLYLSLRAAYEIEPTL